MCGLGTATELRGGDMIPEGISLYCPGCNVLIFENEPYCRRCGKRGAKLPKDFAYDGDYCGSCSQHKERKDAPPR